MRYSLTPLGKINLKKGDLLFFLHIPKTAGTAVYKAISETLFREKTLIIEDDQIKNVYGRYYPDQFSNYIFFRQHSNYYFYQYLPRKPHYLTFLRNPVTRMVSLYNHVVEKPDKFKNRYLREGQDFTAFLEFCKNPKVSNEQTRAIVGYEFSTKKLSDADRLEIAKMRLNEFAFFGIQEFFPQSMQLLAQIFGWKELKTKVINQTKKQKKPGQLSTKETSMIIEHNYLDVQLYEHAVSLFQKRVGNVE